MPLDFNSSRAPLIPSEFRTLVRSICNARDTDETNWLEWKSTLDLGSAEGKTSIARAIVGFANRMPDVAAGYCEGRAYMVVGAAPGSPQGVEEVDPVVLEGRLRPYLGDDGPRWVPHWVTVDRQTVLVIEIAAPRAGDPVYHIRKEGPNVRDGDIFVRRGAATERASSVELRRLFTRSMSMAGLHGLRVLLAEPQELTTVECSPSAIDEWLEEERAAHLVSLRRHIATERSKDVTGRSLRGYTPPRGSGISFSELQDLAERSAAGEDLSSDEQAKLLKEMHSIQQAAAGLSKAFVETKSEQRTPEQYTAEVDQYVERCREALPRVFRLRAAERLAAARFTVCNDTDENYPEVRIVLHVPGTVEAVRAVRRASNEGRLPKPPRPYGPQRINLFNRRPIDNSLPSSITNISAARPTQAPSASVQIENGGSVNLTFSPVDMRPQQQGVPLAPVVLLPQVPLESPVVATWEATSSGVRGVMRGDVHLPLGKRPWLIDNAIAEAT